MIKIFDLFFEIERVFWASFQRCLIYVIKKVNVDIEKKIQYFKNLMMKINSTKRVKINETNQGELFRLF